MLKEEEIGVARDLLRKFYRNNIWGKHHWRERHSAKRIRGSPQRFGYGGMRTKRE